MLLISLDISKQFPPWSINPPIVSYPPSPSVNIIRRTIDVIKFQEFWCFWVENITIILLWIEANQWWIADRSRQHFNKQNNPPITQPQSQNVPTMLMHSVNILREDCTTQALWICDFVLVSCSEWWWLNITLESLTRKSFSFSKSFIWCGQDLNLNFLRRFLSHKFSASLTSFIRDDGDQLAGRIYSGLTIFLASPPSFPPLTLCRAKVNVDKLSPWLTLLISLYSWYLLCILHSPAATRTWNYFELCRRQNMLLNKFEWFNFFYWTTELLAKPVSSV